MQLDRLKLGRLQDLGHGLAPDVVDYQIDLLEKVVDGYKVARKRIFALCEDFSLARASNVMGY